MSESVQLIVSRGMQRNNSGVLTDIKARIGAERLALALALTRTRTIRSPEQSLDAKRAEGVLDPSDILQDWSENERQTLLRRALFDPATYGRIRFHHSSVQEYLAACRLKSLHDNGLSVKMLMRFLFAECYGVRVVIPSMRAIAAWLALSDEDVRRELMEREPETLLSLGDPETLPLPARARLIRAFAAAYGDGGWRGLNIPIDEVRRLAHPELTEVVRDIWEGGTTNEDVQELLLELIWQGAIEGCVDIAKSAANNTRLPVYHRTTGLRALIACGCLDMTRDVADSILTEQGKWPDTIVYALARDLFPKIITVNELIELVKRTPEPKSSADGFSWQLEQIAKTIPPLSDVSVALRNSLADLIWRERHNKQEFYQTSSKYDYLASALAILCERQLSSKPQEYHENDLVWASAIANRFKSEKTGTNESITNLKRHFKDDLAIRKVAFWFEVKLMDELSPAKNDFERLYHVMHDSVAEHIVDADRVWLEEALIDRNSPQNRAVALQALVQLWVQRGRSKDEAHRLQKLVIDNHDLTKELNKCTTPLKPNIELEKMKRNRRRRQCVNKGRERQRLEKWIKWREELLAAPEAAFSSENFSLTVSNLHKWLNAQSGHNSRYNVWNLDALTQAFNSDIASRAAAAFQKTWRIEKPYYGATALLGNATAHHGDGFMVCVALLRKQRRRDGLKN